MTIEEKIVGILESIPAVINQVGVDNIHLQANDEHNNDYSIANPMITRAEISTSYKRTKKHSMYQIAVRGKDKLQINTIADHIIDAFDRVRTEDYNFSWMTSRNPIFDYKEKMHGTALTMNIVARR